MWEIIFISVVVALAVVIYLHGVFSPITLYEKKINDPLMLYYSYKGSKEGLGSEFEKIGQAAKKHFKLSDTFGIYYSMP